MKDSNPENWKRDDTPTSFFNPLDEDFAIDYRLDDGSLKNYIIPTIKISTYPKYLADYFVVHIVDEMINKRNLGHLTVEDRAELTKETEVNG